MRLVSIKSENGNAYFIFELIPKKMSSEIFHQFKKEFHEDFYLDVFDIDEDISCVWFQGELIFQVAFDCLTLNTQEEISKQLFLSFIKPQGKISIKT